jgi:hypothetical protein
MWQRTNQFTAWDGRGRPHLIFVFAGADGPAHLFTADGDLVTRLGTGEYEVADTGEVLRTTAAEAP